MPKKTKIPTLRALVAQQKSWVAEGLQLCGDFPDCNERIAVSVDWTHVLMVRLTDVIEQTRFDESDPLVNQALRRQLANIVATVEAWDKQLCEEDSK